ncbi:hypothetical protein FA13DRAFT_1713574 [Coprinellus micaceus]|uniref:Polynucleotide 5'-hydroxyl-kinase GRC3 n=1 Tax=Coprinellus micaceus TaxID=71717 RepID=A0A4Y7SVL5_COPMI|nr:hypothetical protein FA13DRAFT_1713574 [Coprinellus micaceus]
MSEGNSPPQRPREWTLEPETEYRFELDPDTTLAIKLIKGRAEIFGAELIEGKIYLFTQECKAALYTWHGCTIEMSQPSTEYVSEETPMSAYGNVHIALEQMRVRALSKIRGSPLPPGQDNVDPKLTEPPRVLILGPENAGKTTVAKILANYTVRAGQGWSPLLANVDPSEGAWAVPGSLSVTAVKSSIPTFSPATPLGFSATSAPVVISSHAHKPLVYWYGHNDTKRNPLLMDRLIRNLGENVNDRFDMYPESKAAGVIVDTPASFASNSSPPEHRQKLIKACVDAFRINVILVVGHEKLNVEMQRAYGSYISVVKIPKSGGVVELDHSYRERVQKYQLHTYMYGFAAQPPAGVTAGTLGGEAPPDLVLSPSSTRIKFGELSIYRIGTETMAPSSALPVGAARVMSEMQPVPVNPGAPGSALINAVVAVLAPHSADENERYDEELLDLPVTSFVYMWSRRTSTMSSAFRRLVTAPSSRRAYSVFSSKSGGGRYFNSAKSKAPAVVAAKAKSDTASSSKDASSSTSTASPDGTSPNDPSASRTVADTPGVVEPPSSPRTAVASPGADQQLADSVDDLAAYAAPHPTPSSSDFKLHQFFSLHRPLLLLNNPPSMFTPGPSFQAILSGPKPAQAQEKVPISVFDDYPTEAHLDADAIAARQLGRALAMSRLGSATAWETTLKHLGLDPAKEPERVELQGQMDKDWEDVQILLDSTKRKRRKKMKKHK